MEQRIFQGCGTAMFTPFEEGRVDLATFAANVERQVKAGMDFLVPLGTTGETPTLSDDEKRAVLETAREHAEGRKIVVGVGTNSVPGTLANIRLLPDADAFLVVVPYYNKPPQRGIYEYFKTIASETDKPIILYNVPGRTGSNIEAETTLQLAHDVPNIVGIKEASGKIDQILAILRDRPEDFAVLSGNDDDTLKLMKAGADGVISVASNVAPVEMVQFVHAALKGQAGTQEAWQTAEALNARLSELFRVLFIEPNPIPGKAAMAQLGLMENSLRLPLVPATDATEAIMEKVLIDLFK
ncbi:MAG: 4-hydroxy-tetrahydrodipicolinate synthase [Bacteroidales bacterium]|nr:4-hydroxy-tetrahydrodipicolinate synthase [Bacteroidales bacterium]